MKTLIITLLILTGAGVGIYYSIPKQPSAAISVVRDITDKFLAQPDPSKTIPLFGLSNNKWGGADFRYKNISNVSLNPATEVSIPPANEWLTNEFERDSVVKAFTGEVNQTFIDSTKDIIGRQQSSIYIPVANELNILSQSSAQRRIMLLYSDLLENDPNFSFYNKHTFSMLTSEPDKVKEYFESEVPLNRLDGIEVYLIYQPKNAADDLQFQAVSNFYKNMLETAGAKVTIAANLAN